MLCRVDKKPKNADPMRSFAEAMELQLAITVALDLAFNYKVLSKQYSNVTVVVDGCFVDALMWYPTKVCAPFPSIYPIPSS